MDFMITNLSLYSLDKTSGEANTRHNEDPSC